MTIFHVIKYSPLPDIYNQVGLDILPSEVINSWRRRVEDYAIEQAKSVAHLYSSTVTQKAIDAIYLYRDGKIRRKELIDAAYAAYAATDAAYTVYAANAAAYAANAAYAASYAANAAAAAVDRDAVVHAATYASTIDSAGWSESRARSKEIFTKWLQEELEKYEEVGLT